MAEHARDPPNAADDDSLPQPAETARLAVRVRPADAPLKTP